MLFLILAIACSTAIAVIFKVTDGRVSLMALLAANYAVAVAVALARLAFGAPAGAFALSAPLAVLGVTLGVLFVVSFGLFSRAIGAAGLSVAAATMRLSVAIPFAASWLFWGDPLGAGQAGGLLLAAAAFALISRRPVALAPAGTAPARLAPDPARLSARPSRLAMVALLAGLFLVSGTVDTVFKLFEEEFAAGASRALFLLVVFAVAFALTVGSVVRRGLRTGAWPGRLVLGWGLALGVVNYASAELIMLALAELPGTIVFPVNNVAIVSLAAMLGVTVFGERLSGANWLGLAAAVVAIVLLTR